MQNITMHLLVKGNIEWSFAEHDITVGRGPRFLVIEKQYCGRPVRIYHYVPTVKARTWYADLLKQGYHKP
jgi:hypothetical protein